MGCPIGRAETLAQKRPGKGNADNRLQYIFQRGKQRVGLAVDATNLTNATRLYEKAGMHVSLQYDTYEKELRPGQDLTTSG